MDLGSGVCTRTRPACDRCPVVDLCAAKHLGTTDRYPVKTRKTLRRHESWWLLVLRQRGADGASRVWLERRPAKGIWAGLFCVPVFADEAGAMALVGTGVVRTLPAVSHALTHRELRLHPVLVERAGGGPAEDEPQAGHWVPLDALASRGLPTPVRTMLECLPD